MRRQQRLRRIAGCEVFHNSGSWAQRRVLNDAEASTDTASLTGPALRSRSWSETRVRRGLLFVTIVWSIAGAFLALEFGWPELLHRAIGAGWVPEELVMPIEARSDAAERCAQSNIAKATENTGLDDPALMRQVRYASWMLGQRLGLAAGMAGAGFEAAQITSLLGDLDAWAARLGLPTPRPPEIRHIANELNEFAVYLEADPHCVAASLTSRYGESYGSLYKFGAVIGHAVPARVLDVGGSFAVQIQFYGRGAGIPQELWRPMTLDSLAHLSGADPREKVLRVVARLDEYIRTSQ
jgi:hypothetical protein